MLNIRIRIRIDLNPSKRIRSRIRSENIRTVFIPSLRCWLHEPTPPSEKSALLLALLLVVGNNSSRTTTCPDLFYNYSYGSIYIFKPEYQMFWLLQLYIPFLNDFQGEIV
jgi:hypothetical protein